MQKTSENETRTIVISEIKTKGRPRATMIGGYAHIYTPKDTQEYENLIRSCYLEQNSVNNKMIEEEAITCEIKCFFKPNQQIEKQFKKTGKYPRCTKHKDLDNIAKVILDALNGYAYKDDKQIIDLHVTKEYDAVERIEVCCAKIVETT